MVVRYPLALDQLVELPEWLTGDVWAEADVRSLKSAIEPAGEDGDMRLTCEAELRVRVLANATDRVGALTDVYATQGNSLDVDTEDLTLCVAADHIRVNEVTRGTVLIGENAPGVGTVLATQARPVVGEWGTENGQGRVEGVVEARVLYMPGGSDLPASAEAELPFSLTIPQALNDRSFIDIQVLSAEANALMSDRLELKLNLSVSADPGTVGRHSGPGGDRHDPPGEPPGGGGGDRGGRAHPTPPWHRHPLARSRRHPLDPRQGLLHSRGQRGRRRTRQAGGGEGVAKRGGAAASL